MVEYHESLETLLRKRAENAQALFWAHNHASKWCATWDTRIALSSIILGLFSGAGAVGADSLLPFQGSATLVGVVSLVVSTIQAVNNKLAFAKRSESHRISSLAYQQIYTKLTVQLNMPRNERTNANELLDWLTAETERLIEIEPTIPEETRQAFHKKFGAMEDYAMPTILNGLERIQVVNPSAPETPVAMPQRPVVKLVV